MIQSVDLDQQKHGFIKIVNFGMVQAKPRSEDSVTSVGLAEEDCIYQGCSLCRSIAEVEVVDRGVQPVR